MQGQTAILWLQKLFGDDCDKGNVFCYYSIKKRMYRREHLIKKGMLVLPLDLLNSWYTLSQRHYLIENKEKVIFFHIIAFLLSSLHLDVVYQIYPLSTPCLWPHRGIWFTVFKMSGDLVESKACWFGKEQNWGMCLIVQDNSWFILTVVFLLAYFFLVPSQNWNTRERLIFNATQIEEQQQ